MKKNLKEIEKIIEFICLSDMWIKESFLIPILNEEKDIMVYITSRRSEMKRANDYFIYIYKGVWVYVRYTRKNVLPDDFCEITYIKNVLRQQGVKVNKS